MTSNNSNLHPSGESRFISQVCTNTRSDLIEITEDKLENILIKFLEDYKKSRGWLTPLSVFLTLLITNLTADFKDFLSISKDVWCAIFYIGQFLSLWWTVFKGIQTLAKYKNTNMDFLINKIKNN